MKQTTFYISMMFCGLLSVNSCALFELDNYDGPEETLRGRVIDEATGEPVLTDQGSEGIRVRLTELSWEGNVTPFDFNCMPDGTFQNTKIFEGDYRVEVDGPFIPLVRETSDGEVRRHYRLEAVKPIADHHILRDIHGIVADAFDVAAETHAVGLDTHVAELRQELVQDRIVRLEVVYLHKCFQLNRQ